MVGDWIKMRTDLYRDPKVSVIADALMQADGDLAAYVNQNCQRDMAVTRNVMRNVTVGALVSVWGVMRQRGKRRDNDLSCDGVTLSVLDDIADLPGFGEAMARAGWVVESEGGIQFPRFFDDYNVSPEEKSKGKGAERQRRFRERQKESAVGESDGDSNATSNVTRNVTNNVTVTHREEKRREEKEIPPKPPTGAELRFERFWSAYPSKVGKGAAKRAFEKHRPDDALLSRMLKAVREQSASERWQRDAGQYIPNPATWLNQSRWLDEIPVAASAGDIFAGAV